MGRGFDTWCIKSSVVVSLPPLIPIEILRRPLPPPPVHGARQTVHPGRQCALETLDGLRERVEDRVLRLDVGAEGEELVLLEAQCRLAHLQLGHVGWWEGFFVHGCVQYTKGL